MKLTEFYRVKLLEQRLIQKQMSMAGTYTKDDFNKIEENIKTIKRMYARALLDEQKKEEKKEGRIK